MQNAARELHTWSKCQHPNVLKLLGLVQFRDQIGMVSLWVENGNLLQYLGQHPSVNRCRMSPGICEGLLYLHNRKIIHGDLKGLNVLVDDDEIPLITDFGNALLQQDTLQFTATTAKHNMSPRWAAPELMTESGTCSFSADVYALGMTILETFTGKVPYAGRNDHAVYVAIVLTKELLPRPEDHIPCNNTDGDTLWSLLNACWAHELQCRPKVDQVRDTVRTIT
ncbi:kinase-like protein, partial [Ceratobasidium sp. AG-I]